MPGLSTSQLSDTRQPVLVCGECVSQTPSFSYTICSYLYDFPIQQLLHRIKYQKQRYWIAPLAEQLAHDIILSYRYASRPFPDLLIPVPLHANKRKQRGFNQAALIARYLGWRLHVPMKQHLLIKTVETETQVNLNKMARIKNLQDAFRVIEKNKNRSLLTGKHIALVDDVMTTKATADVASKCLLTAGASRVDIWCLARTPKYRNED
jgi:ComF family protein